MENKKDIFLDLIDASSLLVSTLDTKQILPRAMGIIKNLLDCEAASIMLVDEKEKKLSFEVALGEKGKEIEKITLPLGQGIAGEVALTGEPKIVNDVSLSQEFDRSFDEKSGFKTKNVLCVPLKFQNKVVGVAQAINPRQKNDFDESDLYLLSLFGDQLSLTIESARLHKKILAQSRLEDELNFARTIQESFLPQEFPETDTFSLYAATTPARKVGGDFYDIFPLGDEKIGFTIGDVSGTGMGAALFMAKILSEIKIISQKQNNIDDPSLVLKELNLSILERHPENMFATLIYGIFSPKLRKIILSSAGHPYPFIYNQGQAAWKSIRLDNGLPAGVVSEAHYRAQEIALQPGDLLFLYTDGILEACDKQGNCFIPHIFSRVGGALASASLGETILKELQAFVDPAYSLDDTTLFIVKCK